MGRCEVRLNQASSSPTLIRWILRAKFSLILVYSLFTFACSSPNNAVCDTAADQLSTRICCYIYHGGNNTIGECRLHPALQALSRAGIRWNIPRGDGFFCAVIVNADDWKVATTCIAEYEGRTTHQGIVYRGISAIERAVYTMENLQLSNLQLSNWTYLGSVGYMGENPDQVMLHPAMIRLTKNKLRFIIPSSSHGHHPIYCVPSDADDALDILTQYAHLHCIGGVIFPVGQTFTRAELSSVGESRE